ncbi:transcription repressor NadR [Moorella sulfitireducens (nom. illeg.)]|uniref:transcription repressor NadR n=1 Tax=Neomoorella sulfitireducens TaxID=2972948 RepID=UPI0021ACCF4F|nr:transcription repressor NadR [Moorella sulfitireducens]
MKASERRQRILELLGNNLPRKGTELATLLGVSRQVIVQDVAVLRAAGCNILATPQGYLLPGTDTRLRRIFACQHDLAGLERELQIIVDCGGKIIDVVVEHPLYGEIRGYLMIASRYDVQKFVSDLKASGARPLYTLVGGGAHLHTVEAAGEDILDRIAGNLAREGILLE